MSEAEPVIELHPNNRSTGNSTHGRAFFDFYSSPISPKMHELRARYEALLAMENNLKPSSLG